MAIKNVTIIGGGLMGRQIGLNSAIYGYPTVLYDGFPDVLPKVQAWEDEYFEGRIAKGRMTAEQVEKAKSLFSLSDDLEKAVKDADLIVEAIPEIEDVKREFFHKVSPFLKKGCIVATNSSYMVSSMFKDDVPDASLLCNCHFYNPALVMKFVEIVQGDHTAESTAAAVKEWCDKTNKHAIWMKKELPGFAANRIIAAINKEAKWMVQNGYLTYQDMDAACELGLGHPMGPFRLSDLTGINLSYTMMTETYKKTGVKPDCYDLYKERYDRGDYGRSTGKGFYDYTK